MANFDEMPDDSGINFKLKIIKRLSLVIIFIIIVILLFAVRRADNYKKLKADTVSESIPAISETIPETKEEIPENAPDLSPSELPSETIPETASEIIPETESEIKEETAAPETTAPAPTIPEEKPVITYPEHTASLTIDHDTLFNMNPDYIGWIDVPGTNISYPIVKGDDNNEYLHKSFETDKYSYPGAIFMDSWESIDDPNLILYGHNMKTGSMFGSLRNFKKSKWFNNFLFIDFYPMIGNPRTYIIFSVREASSDINSLNYSTEGFDTEDFIRQAQRQSIQYREVAHDNNNQIITFSTCMNNNAKRLLISGIQVKTQNKTETMKNDFEITDEIF